MHTYMQRTYIHTYIHTYLYLHLSCMHDCVYLGAFLRVHAGQGVLGGEDRKCVLEPAAEQQHKWTLEEGDETSLQLTM